MKVNFTETRIVTQVEYASYEFEIPEDIAALSTEERDQWVYDNHDKLDLDPEYEYGDVLNVQWDGSKNEYFLS